MNPELTQSIAMAKQYLKPYMTKKRLGYMKRAERLTNIKAYKCGVYMWRKRELNLAFSNPFRLPKHRQAWERGVANARHNDWFNKKNMSFFNT